MTRACHRRVDWRGRQGRVSFFCVTHLPVFRYVKTFFSPPAVLAFSRTITFFISNEVILLGPVSFVVPQIPSNGGLRERQSEETVRLRGMQQEFYQLGQIKSTSIQGISFLSPHFVLLSNALFCSDLWGIVLWHAKWFVFFLGFFLFGFA